MVAWEKIIILGILAVGTVFFVLPKLGSAIENIGGGISNIGSGLGSGLSSVGGGLGSGLSSTGYGLGGGLYNIGAGIEQVGSGTGYALSGLNPTNLAQSVLGNQDLTVPYQQYVPIPYLPPQTPTITPPNQAINMQTPQTQSTTAGALRNTVSRGGGYVYISPSVPSSTPINYPQPQTNNAGLPIQSVIIRNNQGQIVGGYSPALVK